jgi:dolichol-phosphate mannosyltransferase
MSFRTEKTISDIRLSIVVPTFNERDNVAELARRVEQVLGPYGWEMIYVDDGSPDGTAALVRGMAVTDRRIRGIERHGRRGLSSAVVEGMMASAAPVIAVMDADLQHDESILPEMYQAVNRGEADVAVGSRYVEGGSTGDWQQRRASLSRLATRLAGLVYKGELQDPMSGFFMVRRAVLESALPRLSSTGFKILLDLVASAQMPLRIVEVPITFRNRQAGESKLDYLVLWEYGMFLLDKLVGRFIPVRFLSFSLVGGFGILVHMLVLFLLFHLLGVEFLHAQIVATYVAMTSNYLLNNVLTYRDKRLRGVRLFYGWISFTLVCSVGAVANVGVADYLFQAQWQWAISALAGILVGTVWNYVITAFYTWRQR